MSGYAPHIIAPRGVLEKGIHFIPKPISMKDLGVAVRKVLDETPADGDSEEEG
ncbi:MAG: hypothetical protein WC450_09990 [Candidatus Omnitrophota bacterium]|jgi:hypothetical protein